MESDGIGTAVDLGGVGIQPGDLIVGDIDGVVAIPAADVHETLDAGLERHKAEGAMLQQLRTGEGTLNSLELDRPREPA